MKSTSARTVPIAPGKRWAEFEADAPALATAGRRLLHQGGEVANAFFATVAPDGGPRLHPVCPVLADGEFWLFIVSMSPKYRDLRRNGMYALHTMPVPGAAEEFYIRGKAAEVNDAAARRRVVDATAGRQGTLAFEALFRCSLVSVLHTAWSGWGTADAWPSYEKWAA